MIEICLFAGEWQTTVYGDIGFCHIIYHPLNKHPFIYLVKKEKEIEVPLKNTGLLNKYRLYSYRLIARKAVSVLRTTG